VPLGAFLDSTESSRYPDTHSSVAPLLLNPDSDLGRTPFRAISDTLPILSDTIPMVPKNCPTSARNTVRYESEPCPAKIGMLSDRNWNQCPTETGIRSFGERDLDGLGGHALDVELENEGNQFVTATDQRSQPQ